MFRIIIFLCLLQFIVSEVIHGRVLLDGDPSRGRRIPNEAVLTVELRDATLADAPSTVLQQAEFYHLVAFPIFYEIQIPASIDPLKTHILQARVTKNDELLFVNDVRVPVQTDAESSVKIDIPVIDVKIDDRQRQERIERRFYTWPELLGRDGDYAVEYIKEKSGLTNVQKVEFSKSWVTDYQKDRVLVVVEDNIVVRIPKAG